MEQFEKDLKDLFLHTHSTDTLKIQNDFQLIVTKAITPDQGQGGLLLDCLDLDDKKSRQNDSKSPIYYIKFISRKHGLPPTFNSEVYKALKYYPSSETLTPFETFLLTRKLQIAQCLKYSVQKNPEFINFYESLQIIEITIRYAFPKFGQVTNLANEKQLQLHMGVGADMEVRDKLIKGILTMMLEIIGIKLESTLENNQADNEMTISKIQQFHPFLDVTMSRNILSKLERRHINQVQVDDVQSFFDTQDDPSDLPQEKTNSQTTISHQNIFGFGQQVLSKSGKSKRTTSVQADVVKTQQVVTSAYKQNVSEKTEIKSISLSNALNGNRTKGAERNFDTEISPGRAGQEGSDRGWFGSTWSDTQMLNKMATNGDTIKKDDLVWLDSKCQSGFNVLNTIVGIETMFVISDIFAKISIYQKDISPDIFDSLTKSFFSLQLDSRYDKPREKFLIAFEAHSQRLKGQISPYMTTTLSQFKKTSECTIEMKRSIWRIFAKDDANFQKSFEGALQQLKEFQKSRDTFQHIDQHLDYIGSQVAIVDRCKELQQKFDFINDLMVVLEDKDENYSIKVKAVVAAIIENFMSHDLSAMFNLSQYKDSLDDLVDFYNHSNDNKFQYNGQEEEQRVEFESSLIRAILKILDKATIQKDDRFPEISKNVLDLLVRLATRNVDRPLEVLIVVTICNLIIENCLTSMTNDLVQIFGKLAYKLCRNDAIDPRLSVYLEEDLSSLIKNDQDDDEDNSMELTYVSAMVAQILLFSLENYESNDRSNILTILDMTTIQYLAQALQTNQDKGTRIRCAECLFQLVVPLGQSLSENFITSIRHLTFDSIVDVQIYMTCVYCTALERLCCQEEEEFVISQDDLDSLPKLYVSDDVLMLGEKDYSIYVNNPILNMLKSQSKLLPYSDEIFQLLTFILNSSDLNLKPILKIIQDQLTSPKITKIVKLPPDCFEAVEEIFLSQIHLYEDSGLIMIAAGKRDTTLLSTMTVEHSHKIMMSSDQFSTNFTISFSLLDLSQNYHDLAEHIFQDYHLTMISLNLFNFWRLLDPQFEQKTASELIQFLNKVEDELTGMEVKVNDLLGLITRALILIQEYQTHNRKLQFLHFQIMQTMLFTPMTSSSEISSEIIKCLISAAENGQSLSPNLIQICFENFRPSQDKKSRDTNLNILSLALSLVHNNQSLPDNFIKTIVTNFYTTTDLASFLGEDKEKGKILFIISKLAQTTPSSIPLVGNVASTLCSVWEKSEESRKELTKRTTLKAFGMSGGGLASHIQTWKNSRTHRYRLEILVTLSGLGVSQKPLEEDEEPNDETVDMWQVHSVFLQALKDVNSQVSETGLRGLISINWHGASYCEDEDLELLFKIECKPQTSPGMKTDISNFFDHNKEYLPANLRLQIGLLDDLINNAEDDSLLEKLEYLIKTEKQEEAGHSKSCTFIESQACQERLESILFQKKKQDLTTVIRVLNIIDDYPYKSKLSSSIFEAVAFTMVNHNQNGRLYKRVQIFSRDILEKIIQEKIPVSETLINHLLTDKDKSTEILIKIKEAGVAGQNDKKLENELKSTIETNALTKILTDAQDKIVPEDFIKEIMALDFDNIDKTLDLEILKKCLTLQDNILEAVPQLTNLMAASIATLPDISIFEGKVSLTIGKIVETVIMSHEPHLVHTNVVRAYQKIIADSFDENLEACLTAMTKIFLLYQDTSGSISFSQNKREIQMAILECILVAVKNADDVPTAYIPLETFKLVTNQLQSPHPTYRHQTFKIIRLLKSTDILLEGQSQIDQLNKISIPDIKQMTINVFKQIYGGQDDDLAKEEILKDLTFAADLLEFLYSLTYWDLKSLTKVKEDQSKWREILLISNFISCFAQTENEKLKLKIDLTKMYTIFGGDQAQKILFDLSNILDNSEPINFSIERTVECLNQLNFDLITEILTMTSERSKSCNPAQEMYNRLEKTVLANGFGQKFTFQITPGILMMMTDQLVNAARGISHTWNILAVVSKIDEINSLDNLIQYLTVNGDILEKIGCLKEIGLTCKIDLAQFKNYLETQIILNLLPEDVKKRRGERLEWILLNLLAQGITGEELTSFYKLTDKKTTGRSHDCIKIFEHVIFQSFQYQINLDIFKEIVKSMNTPSTWNSSVCLQNCTRIINRFAFGATKGTVKSLERIISELKDINPTISQLPLNPKKGQLTANWDDLEKLVKSISKSEIESSIHQNSLNIADWSEEDIKKWSKLKQNKNKIPTSDQQQDEENLKKEREFIIEALMVAKRAFNLTTNFEMTNVQILACLFALNNSIKKDSKIDGLLQQVATGSGKSAIIATIAVIKCVQSYTVDIYTSNSILAERDAKDWSKFYSFFDVTSDHNGDKGSSYISGEKSCYNKNIVYGDCAQFQFDYLRDTYSDLGTRRTPPRPYQFAIMDEVDTMFIDDNSKLARLSSTLPGMDLLQVLYHFIWDRLCFLNSHIFQLFTKVYFLQGQSSVNKEGIVSYSFADEESGELKVIDNLMAYIIGGGKLEPAQIYLIDNVENFVVTHLTEYATSLVSDVNVNVKNKGQEKKSERVKLPKHLKEFVKTQIPKWIDSALTALTFQENQEYVIDEGQVKPVDFKTTGVVQSSTNWNNGLHQFIQIKHGLKMGSESVTTNFLSNLAMTEMYQGHLVGFTGTLGSTESRRVLNNVYQVNLMTLPETYLKRYVQFPDLVVQSDKEWLQEILITTLEEVTKRRGVLIICETIRQADIIIETLNRFKIVKVKEYTKNMQNQEKHVERIHPGDVIVATNLAGRGTDIKTTDIEKFGGLHVCLTFLPASLRVDEQAFGRTSRQGNRGTGQLVVMNNLENSQNSSFLRSTLSKKLIEKRDEIENETLNDFVTKNLPGMKIRGELFQKFSQLLSITRLSIREKEKTILSKSVDWVKNKVKKSRPTPTFLETITLQAVEERWAMFLRKVDNEEIPRHDAHRQFDEFKEKIENDQDTDDLISKGENCFYFIQLGNYLYSQDTKYCKTLDQAIKNYEKAWSLDPDFAVASLIGQAYIGLKGRENMIAFNSHETSYKEAALKLLQKSIPILHNEMAMLTVMQALVKKNEVNRGQDFCQNLLFQQLAEKSNILGSYLKNIEATILLVQKSLRRVYCTGIQLEGKREVRNTRIIGNSKIQKPNRQIPWENFKTYNLAFHDLTATKDLRENDQAINTLSEEKMKKFQNIIQNFSWKSFYVTLTCPNVDFHTILSSSEILQQTCNRHVELLGLQLDDDTGKLNIELEKVGNLKFDSYSLEIGGDPLKLYLLVMSNAINSLPKEIKIEARAFKFIEIVQRQHEEILSDGQVERAAEIKQFSQNFKDDDCSIKIIGLKSVQQIEKILRAVKEILVTPNSITLTINSLDVTDIDNVKKIWAQVLRDNVGSTNVHFSRIDNEHGAKTIIRELRKLDINFILRIDELTLQAANTVLRHASLEQENISQIKWQELINLYASHRLPLAELRDLSSRGISLLVKFNENGFVPWITVASLVGLAALQATAGGLLMCTVLGSSLGMGILTEGMSDLMAAQRAYATRDFSWSDYRTQKAVSIVISATTMGLSTLKDGAKVASTLAQSAARELTEQAGTRILINGSVVTETIKVAGKNLKTLALQKVVVSSAETGARVGLKCLGDSLSDFCFDQLRDSITKEVTTRAMIQFGGANFKQILSFYNALDRCASKFGTGAVQQSQNQLSSKVLTIVQWTTNAKAIMWLELWASVGGPLVSGILSSPKFLGSHLSRLTIAYGIVTGMSEIHGVIDRVFLEVFRRLEEQKPDMVMVIQKYCGFSRQTAQNIYDNMTFKSKHENIYKPDDFSIVQFPNEENTYLFSSTQQSKNLQNVFKELDAAQKNFDLSNGDMSQLIKLVVEVITTHIIKVANAHLVSPVMSSTVGNIVVKISQDLQDRFAVHENEKFVEKSDQITKKVEEIKTKREEEKTAEDKTFLETHQQKVDDPLPTLKTTGTGGLDNLKNIIQQIKDNSHYFTLAWEKRQLILQALGQTRLVVERIFDGNIPVEIDSTAPEVTQQVEELKQNVEGVLSRDPADMSQMMTLGRENKLHLKIVDETYKPSQQDKDKQVKIILIKKSSNDHQLFLLLDTQGDVIKIPGSCESVDNGYEIMGLLTGKSVDQLRIQVAKVMLQNPLQFVTIHGACTWILQREPVEATSILTGKVEVQGPTLEPPTSGQTLDKKQVEKIVQDKLKHFILFRMKGSISRTIFLQGSGDFKFCEETRSGTEEDGSGDKGQLKNETKVPLTLTSQPAPAPTPAPTRTRQIRQKATPSK